MKSARTAMIPILVLLAAGSLTTAPNQRIGVFSGIYQPQQILVEANRIYLVQVPEVLIYSRPDLAVLHRFGRRGNGPGEFSGDMVIFLFESRLVVNSAGKVSLYTTDGALLREIRPRSPKAGPFHPHPDGFIAQGYTGNGKGEGIRTIDLYRPDLEKIREIYRYPLPEASGTRYHLLDPEHRALLVTGKDILLGRPDGTLLLLDTGGTILQTIGGGYPRIPFTESHRRALVDRFLLANPGKRGSYVQWKDRLAFPNHFPPVQLFGVSQGRILVLTHQRREGAGKLYIYDREGNLRKTAWVPIRDFSPRAPWPLDFFGGDLYQLVENPDTEEWELHRSRITD